MAKIKDKILVLLAYNPEKEFFSQDIAQKTSASKASASLILRKLTYDKYVTRKQIGHMRFYRINVADPRVKQYKINQAIEALGPLVSALRGHSSKIILFGSAARGEQDRGSDYDLFVLSRDKDTIRSLTAGKKIAGLAVKAVVKSANEWLELESLSPEFFHEIINGITLYDSEQRI